MGWMCSSIIVCAVFRGVCALARRVNIEVVSVVFCSILWHCARHMSMYAYSNHTGGLSALSVNFVLDVVVHLSCWLGGFS